MEVTNNTARGIIMGTHICSPGVATEVPDSYSSNARVQELIAEGSMSETAAPPPDGGDAEGETNRRREEARRDMERPGPSQPSDEHRPPAAQHPAPPASQLPAQPARPPVTAAQQPAKPAVSPMPRPSQPRPEPKA